MPFVRVVNYHEVLPKDFQNFKKQIQWLEKRYKFISFADLSEFLRGGVSLSKPGLLLTFDDALESNYRVLFPYLKELGLHAVFFVPVGLLGKKGYMSLKQVKECLESGLVEIGSHTVTHKALSEELSQIETNFEVIHSKRLLEEKLHSKVVSFCWPFGGDDCYSTASFSSFFEAKYLYGFTSFSEPIIVGTCPHYLPRTNLQTYWDVSEIAFQMSSCHDRRFIKRKKAILQSYNILLANNDAQK